MFFGPFSACIHCLVPVRKSFPLSQAQGCSDIRLSVPITQPLLKDGAPRGTCLRPGAEVSGSQTNVLTPWYDGRAEIIPFRYLPALFGGKGISHGAVRHPAP